MIEMTTSQAAYNRLVISKLFGAIKEIELLSLADAKDAVDKLRTAVLGNVDSDDFNPTQNAHFLLALSCLEQARIQLDLAIIAKGK